MPSDKKIVVETPVSKCWIVNNWMNFSDAEILLKQCALLHVEKNPTCFIYGKKCIMHRSIGFFSDVCDGYEYANQTSTASPLNDFLALIIENVNKFMKSKFNGILVNVYKDGEDSIGAHSDDESELWDGKVVCLTLGASRTFRIKQKTNGCKIDVSTKHGQLLVMEGNFQQEFTHEIPVQKKIIGKRISLTFRYHGTHKNLKHGLHNMFEIKNEIK